MLKNEIKKQLELDLLSICVQEPEYINEILTFITNPCDEHKPIHEILTNIDFDQYLTNDMMIELCRGNVRDLAKYQSHHAAASLTELKLKKYKEICLSMDVEKLFRKKLVESMSDENGLDLLLDTIDELKLYESKLNLFAKDKTLFEKYDELIHRIMIEREQGDNLIIKSHCFPTFTKVTQGLRGGNLVTIAGAYKSGKTTFAVQLCLDFACISQYSVGVFSLEMSAEEIQRKMIAAKSQVESEKLRNPKLLSALDIHEIETSKKKFQRGKIFVSEKYINTEAEIRQKCIDWVKNYGVKIVLIDYIGLVEKHNKKKGEERERELSYISRFLKRLAMELDIVIVSLAQLNRQGKEKPTSSNLAESIAIARDSDFIFIIYHPHSAGLEKIKIDGFDEYISANDFMVVLSDSRHTASNKSFLITLNQYGEFSEKDNTRN